MCARIGQSQLGVRTTGGHDEQGESNAEKAAKENKSDKKGNSILGKKALDTGYVQSEQTK